MPVSTADLVSPAMACLRVSIHGAPGGHTVDDLQALVGKVINAFLETRWEWPRQFEQMTPYAFVLTDPRAERMDKRGLTALAAELQLKLFGAEGEGEVSLLMFEGSDVEVHRFARLSVADVDRMLAGEAIDPPFSGTLDRISADRAREDRMARIEALAERLQPQPPPSPVSPVRIVDLDEVDLDLPLRAAPAPRPTGRTELVYGGLYLSVTQSFVGSIALCRRPRRDRNLFPDLGSAEPLPGMDAEEFDEGCVEGVLKALAEGAAGLLFTPLSFSSLVRPTGRRAYARFLCHLPAEQRDRLGAAIYDTPRAPSFFALSTIRRFLDPFFGEIDLHISDPMFEVEKLPPEMVSSVTLVPPDREPAGRIAAIRRFMGKRDAYKKRRIWPGVAPVMKRAELETCLSLRVPMICGPAVAELASRPVGARTIDANALPLRAQQQPAPESRAPEPQAPAPRAQEPSSGTTFL